MRWISCIPGGTISLFVLAFLASLLGSQGAAAESTRQRIGVVLGSDLSAYQLALESFRAHLEQHGLGPDRAELFIQSPNPDFYSWANSARRAQAAGCRVLVVFGDAAAEAARREIVQTPLVLAFLDDPAPTGAVPSRRANETGIRSRIPVATLLKTGAQIHPFSRLSAPFSTEDPETDELAAALNLATHRFQSDFRKLLLGGDVAGALRRLSWEAGEPLYLSESGYTERQLEEILAFAAERKLPVLSQVVGHARKGALVSLEADPAEQGEWAARSVVRILRGEKPSQIPYHEPTRIQLVINLRTAQALGLRVPFQALSSATAVIQ